MAQEKTNIDGIIISKTLYRDRDLICNILTRSGKKLPVLFFGGRGGGKKQKTSVLELGYLVNIEIDNRNSKNNQDLKKAIEWNSSWIHKEIRNNFDAFSLMCFMLEVSNKISIDMDDFINEDSSQAGFFKVLSNALFFLEDSLQKSKFNSDTQAFIFLVKLLFELGITPNLSTCIHCEKSLIVPAEFIYESGGFSCEDCSDISFSENHYNDLMFFKENISIVRVTKYISYEEIKTIRRDDLTRIFNYLIHHYQIDRANIRTISNLKI